MSKRDFLRHVPYFSRLMKSLDAFEAENKELRNVVHSLIFMEEEIEKRGDPSTATGPDGLQLPPPALRYLSTGTVNPVWFMEGGKRSAQSVLDALERKGFSPAQFRCVLDFGCGCGRVLRHMKNGFVGEIHGSDRNSFAIRWCRKNLAHASFGTNGLLPPLSYEANKFDLVYAFSVFTHLDEVAQSAWLNEFARVLQPGNGYLLLSLHGEGSLKELTAHEAKEFRQGHMVTHGVDYKGTNYCAVFHPEKYVRSHFCELFEIVDFFPAGATSCPFQDLYTLRKRG